MFAAAQIYFDSRQNPTSLRAIMTHLQGTVDGSYRLVEWRGFSDTVPQLRVEAATPWTLQIESDPDYIPDEIAALIEEESHLLAPVELSRLQNCDSIIAAMASRDQALPDVSGGSISLTAAISLDPSQPKVRKTLLEVARLVDGITLDLVADEWLQP